MKYIKDSYLKNLDKEIETWIERIEMGKRKGDTDQEIERKQQFLYGLKRARGIYKMVTQAEDHIQV